METIDDETVGRAMDFIRAAGGGGQAVLRAGGTAPGCTSVPMSRTSTAGSRGPSGDEYHDGMVEHDMHVGKLLELLDELGIADNTIVFYSTDNGPALQHLAGCRERRRSAARRTPTGRAPTGYRPSSAGRAGSLPAKTLNGIVAHEDWLPTFAAAAGDDRHQGDLLRRASSSTAARYRNYIDGYDMLDYLSKPTLKSRRDIRPRRARSSCTSTTTARWWRSASTPGRRSSSKTAARPSRSGASPSPSCAYRCCSTCGAIPFEKAQHNSNTYHDWFLDRVFVLVPMQGLAAKFLTTMQEYPPSQSPGSFNLTKIEEQLRSGVGSN